jgi:hypothetical protein
VPYGSGVLGSLGSIMGSGLQQGYHPQQAAQWGPTQQQAYQQAQMQQQAYQNQTASNTNTFINFANFTTATTTSNAGLYGYATAPTPDYGRSPSDHELEQYLAGKLQRERRILLQHARHALPPVLDFTADRYVDMEPMKVVDGHKLPEGNSYVLPDGALMVIDHAGNYGISDRNAKVVYRANRIREFNPFLNASDQLEHFIREVGRLDGVEQTEVLDLPVGSFINWLVLQAALRDGDRTDHLPRPEAALKSRPRLALPKPTHVEVRRDLQRDCLIVREIHEKVIPRSALVDGEWDLTQKYGIRAA